jgi:hypothetical protein
VAESLDIVEIDPDVPPRLRDYETLVAGRERATPAWLVRLAALRAGTPLRGMAVAVIVLGAVLSADGPVHARLAPPVDVSPVRNPAPYFYDGSGECPTGVVCSVENRARQDMWASFNALFVDARATSGHVWFAPATGVVYVQTLRATQQEITIILNQARVSHGRIRSSGPSVEFDVPMRWGESHELAPRTVIVSAQRGPWQITATLRGPWDSRMPIAAARAWVMAVPTPD